MLSTDDSRSWSATLHSRSVRASPVRLTSRRQVAMRALEPNSASTSTMRRYPLPGSVPGSGWRSRSCSTLRFTPGISSLLAKSRARMRSADAERSATNPAVSPAWTMRSTRPRSRRTPSSSCARGIPPPDIVSARSTIARGAFIATVSLPKYAFPDGCRRRAPSCLRRVARLNCSPSGPPAGLRRRRPPEQQDRQVVGELGGVGVALHGADHRRADAGEAVARVGLQRGLEPDLVERLTGLVFGFRDAVAVHRDHVAGLDDRAPGRVG